ncbi:hypothetical protein H310_08679 [Aphanomyces invadans]|uniref:Uncharacterized protein n=1 Tax=Aphanomyces invadans TaxID=157072 RepID=A0A024TWL6_9STRA|nr:hypothetical protein H310_08679 [Aphanomyces invadans]ETV98555.1 hypothetical protein H310_08679 [Aphanomyces invadans]|eukprot:XP_008872752.1 hypothetical protein H310_08679 [Aphanomyces invadans]
MDVTKGEFVGAVTALHFSADGSLLYAAVGCTLYVYDSATGKMFTSPLSIWSQGTIHGIDIGRTRTSSLVLCFGQKQLGLVTSFPDSSSEVTPLSPSIVATECMDWILDARLLLDDMDSSKVALPKIAVGLSHNMVHIWDPSTQAMLQRCQCTERTILYAMGIYGRSLDSLIVAAGTVFQHILLWHPPPLNHDPSTSSAAQVTQRLHRHDGVLFQLTWSATGRQLASVSDDRSVQLWSNLNDAARDDVALPRAVNLQHAFESRFRGWGHTARVWDVQFTRDGRLVSASEDATVKVWSVAGECLATLSGHLDTNVWRVAVHPIHTTWVATGGGDNAIKLWDVDSHIANQSLVHVKAVPTLVAPSATTNDGGLVAERSKKNHHAMAVRSLVALASSIVWISDQGHVGKSSWSAHAPAVVQQFQSNVCCVAATTDLIAVGDVTGHLRMLSGTSLAELAIVQGHMGRIMSIWIIETSHREIGGVTVFTTGVDLTLREWTFHSPTSSLTLVATYQCPSKNGCISALAIPTTDGGNDDRTLLWCGDARGNLCVFDRAVNNLTDHALLPVQPMLVQWQVHGKDVVSSLLWRNQLLYSCGHDGFVCTLRWHGESKQLHAVRRVGIKGLSTLKTMHWTRHNDLVVFGFHAAQAILVNVTQSVRLMSLECGGYRRPHALFFDPNERTGTPHVFAFTTPGTTALQVHTDALQPMSTTLNGTRSPLPLSWHGHHHSKMGTCVAFLDPSACTSWIVTGGEDCALRLHRVVTVPSPLSVHTTFDKQIHCIDAVTMHGTNVRSLAVVGRDWVVSGGGKQSLHLWRVVDGHLDHVAEHTPSNVSQDQRILALSATALLDDERGDATMASHGDIATLAVFATNSEGQTAFFTANALTGLSFHLMWTGHTNKPILSCALTSNGFFVTGATDGYVVVWDVAPLLSYCPRREVASPRQVYQYRAHDMGVNCVCIRPTGATTFDIVSGGDDQCIAHAAVDATDRSNITVRHLHGKRNASASALKAIQAMDDVVVAAGYDQRVTAWEMNGGHEWTRRGVAYSECADIAGVALRRCDGGAIEAVVVGKGMQTIAFR